MVVRVKMDKAAQAAYFERVISKWSPAALTTFNGMVKGMAEDMVKFAKISVPKKTGRLASHIFEYRKDSLFRVFTVGFRGEKEYDKGFYGKMVETGTKPHKIGIHKKEALKIGDRFAMNADHPGTSPHEFFFPAYRLVKGKKTVYKNQAIKSLVRAVG